MLSRRKRKRERQRAEATAKCPKSRGGWGAGLPTSLSDLVLLRQAINEDWPIAVDVQQAIIDELADEIESMDARRAVAVARTFLAMESANLRARKIA